MPFLIQPAAGDAFDKLVTVVNVEHQDAMPAVFQQVADAGHGDVQQAMLGGRRVCEERPGSEQQTGQQQGE